MSSEELGWSVTESDSFIECADVFVPSRSEQISIIIDLLSCLDDGGDIIDLCCGEGRLSQEIYNRYKKSKVHFYDGSSVMLNAVKKLNLDKNRHEIKLFDIADKEWRDQPKKYQAITSSLAIHHLGDLGKQDLFQDIYHMLKDEGVFVYVDIMKHEGKEVANVAANSWDKATYKQSLEVTGSEETFNKFQAMNWNMFTDPDPDPIDQPSTIYDQLTWLKSSGFKDVDLVWLKAGHAIFFAKK